MSQVAVSYEAPAQIISGFGDGILERVGGVIRNVGSKQVVGWLREVYETGEPVVSGLLKLPEASSIGSLNLAISTMGFMVVMRRLGVIERQLKESQEILDAINYKIDLSFYANFRAAIDLQTNAFTMTNPETRRATALQAVNHFLVAEHHYTNLVDLEVANGSRVADDYLATLSLAYVTEVRCYLELEELDTADRRLGEALLVLRPRFDKLVNTLLTSNPAAYLHPSLKNEIGLQRLTRIYQWSNPGMSEEAVFEAQRENLFKLAERPEAWISTLPQAIHIPKAGGFFGQKNVAELAKQFNRSDVGRQLRNWMGNRPSLARGIAGLGATPTSDINIFGSLPRVLLVIETIIEDFRRLEAYLEEIRAVRQLGLSFQEWRALAPPSNERATGENLMYITVS